MDLVNDFIDSLTFADFVYMMSGLFTFSAYMVTNMLLLRSLIVTAAILGLSYGIMISQTMFTLGQSLLILLNLIQIGIILYNTKAFFLSEPWKTFYLKSFTAMEPREFMQLIKLAKQQTSVGEQLCYESESHERLIYLLKGEVEITSNGEQIATAQQGNFLGEMSFLTGGEQEADVVAKGEIEYLSWDRPTMRKLKRKKPQMYTKMLNALGVDLINKLRVHRDTIIAHQSLPPVV
jgi:hypothetical protein